MWYYLYSNGTSGRGSYGLKKFDLYYICIMTFTKRETWHFYYFLSSKKKYFRTNIWPVYLICPLFLSHFHYI